MTGEGAHGREPREVGHSAGRERVGQLGLRESAMQKRD